MKKTKFMLTFLTAIILLFATSSSVFAFSDIKKDAGRSYIEHLHKLGVIRGDSKDKFNPKGAVTASTAFTYIVSGLNLNLDKIRFVKAPKASDYFTNVKDNASYANAFIIAQLNGLDIPKDIRPDAKVTREQFAHWLFKGINAKGDWSWIESYVAINDEKNIDAPYKNSVQKLIVAKIVTLDAKQNFRPDDKITRSEAAIMLDKAISFVKSMKPVDPTSPTSPLSDIKLTSEAFAAGINKVTVSAQATGYGIEIASITFKDKKAVVNYRVIAPAPGTVYPQVIMTITASAYIDSSYTPVLGSAQS